MAEPSVSPEATPADVAALLTARTKDKYGNELGRWSDDTRPTTEQVQVRIEIARTLVRDGIGPLPDTCAESAESCVALLAAMLCEAAFWPEQTQGPQSTYERLRDIYQQAIAGLQACVDSALSLTAYDLDVSGRQCPAMPFDYWQRDLDNPIARRDAREVSGGP